MSIRENKYFSFYQKSFHKIKFKYVELLIDKLLVCPGNIVRIYSIDIY